MSTNNIHVSDATMLPHSYTISSSSATSAITNNNMALVLIPAIALLTFIRSYLRWYNSKLWKIPGPPRKKSSWLLGQFAAIRNEPFLAPHARWWKEASRELTAMSITDSTVSAAAATATGLSTKKKQEEQYADMIHFCSLLGKHRVSIFNPEIVHKILTCPRALYASPTPRYLKVASYIRAAFGKYGLVQMDGKDWYRHRRIINPSFQTKLVRDCLNSVAPALVQRFIMHWREGTKQLSDSGNSGDGTKTKARREIDVAAHLSTITLDILGLTALSCNFNAIDSIQNWSKQNQRGLENNVKNGDNDDDAGDDNDYIPPVSHALVKALSALMKPTKKRILLAVLGLGVLDFEAIRTKKILNKVVDQVIINAQERKINNADNADDSSCSDTARSKYTPKSLLEALLAAKEESVRKGNGGSGTLKHLNHQELRDELKIFIVAGHETTSVWCYWCCFALSKYPDVQQKVYDDVIKNCPPGKKGEGESSNEDNLMTVEIVNQMSYLDAFMKEVLRMYPPIALIARKTAKNETFNDTSTNGDLVLPKGTQLMIPIYLLHRHPKYWDQPDTFLPERWLKKSNGDNMKSEFPASHPSAYLPFSAGPRNCIGYQFATMETKLILAPIVRAFALELAPSLKNVDFQMKSFLTMKAKPDIKICLRDRLTGAED